MESFLEDHLVVINMRELEEYTSGCLGEREAAFELHLLADGGCFLHAEAVRGREEEGSLSEKVL